MLVVFLVASLVTLLVAGGGRLLEPSWGYAPQLAIVINALAMLWATGAFTYELLGTIRMTKRTHDNRARQQEHDSLKARWLIEGLLIAVTSLLPLLLLGGMLSWTTGWILGSAHAAQATFWMGLAYLLPLTLCSLPMLTVAFASLRQLAADLYGN